MGIEAESWFESVTRFHQYFFYAAGNELKLREYYFKHRASEIDLDEGQKNEDKHSRWKVRGINGARKLFRNVA